jgi:hypothetical protein
MARYALYDRDGKFYMATDNGKEATHILYNVLKTGSMLKAKHLTQIQLLTLTLEQAHTLQPSLVEKD